MNGWVWSNCGMILTGESWKTGRKSLYSVDGRWMDEYGAMVEWYWQGKTEVLGDKHYTAWMVDEWMSMEQWWNDTDRGKLNFVVNVKCHSATNAAWTPPPPPSWLIPFLRYDSDILSPRILVVKDVKLFVNNAANPNKHSTTSITSVKLNAVTRTFLH